MDIASLFVSLGVKGSDKTTKSLTDIKTGLKDTASVSLEAKAAIIGAVYAFERLMSASGQKGTDLTNFNAVLGVTTQTLERYQYAARQVGVSNQAVEGTFKSLQNSMTKVLLNGEAPSGLARLAQVTGNIAREDIAKFAAQPQLLIDKLQEYANKENNITLRNATLKSFGIGDDVLAAFARDAFRPDVMSKAPVYSEKDIAALDRANIAWSNLGDKIERAFGHFNAAHGGQLVADISKITTEVIKLVEAFQHLAEKLKLFEWFGKSIQGWTTIFQGATAAVDKISGASSNPKKAAQLKGETNDFITNQLPEMMKLLFGGLADLAAQTISDKGPHSTLYDNEKTIDQRAAVPGSSQPTLKLVMPPAPLMPAADKTAAPSIPPQAFNQTGAQSQEINVNQNFTFPGDSTDPNAHADAMKREIKAAFRQSSAQSQWS